MNDQAQAPSIGRIVRFTDDTGEIWPAVIVRVGGDQLVDLNVFTLCGVDPQLDTLRGRPGVADTWHWPER